MNNRTPMNGLELVGFSVILGLLLGLGSVGCSWLTSTGKAIAADVVDCTKAETVKTSRELGPLVEALIAQGVTGGKVDWTGVKELAKGFSVDVGGCVLANTVERYLHPRPPAPGAPKSAVLELDAAALRSGFRELAVERFAGKRFRTPLEAGL